MCDKVGADAVRMYLANSGLVRAETLNFAEKGVVQVVTKVFLPWYNSFRFLLQNINRWENAQSKKFAWEPSVKYGSGNEGEGLTNYSDKWIIAANQLLVKQVADEMDKYLLYKVVPRLVDPKEGFLEKLSNWYVRINHARLKGEKGPDEQYLALNVLFEVIINTCICIAPYVPFITEAMYQQLVKCISPENKEYHEKSIHFLLYPKYDEALLNPESDEVMDILQ